MSRWQIVLALAALSAVGPLGRASDDRDERFGKLARLGPGVYEVKKDAEGRIQSCVVVGQSPFNAESAKDLAREEARRRAELDAKARFLTDKETQAIPPEGTRELQLLHAQMSREDHVYLVVMHWEAPSVEPLKCAK